MCPRSFHDTQIPSYNVTRLHLWTPEQLAAFWDKKGNTVQYFGHCWFIQAQYHSPGLYKVWFEMEEYQKQVEPM